MPVETEVEEGLRRLAPRADAVVDLADEPVVPASRKLRLAALALSLGLAYEAPGARLEPPRYEPVGFDGPKLAVIATGKRTGKTAVAGHWAALLREPGADPVIVCMGRGGPAEPRLAEAAPSLDELIAHRGERLACRVRLSRGRGDRGRADGRLPARGRRLRGRAVRVERAGGRAARGVAGAGRDRVRGLRRVHPAGGGGPHRVHPRRRARRSRSPSTGSRGPTSCSRPRAQSTRPPARCRSRSAPSRSRTCRTTRAWRSSPPAPTRCTASPTRCSSRPTWRGAPRSPRTSTAPRPSGADVYLTELKAAAIDTVAMRARARGRARRVHPQPAPSASTTHSSTCTAMPAAETIVVHKGHGLPYSKGLMAQAISATGLVARAAPSSSPA